MTTRRSVVLILNKATGAASSVTALPVPTWADSCMIHVVATTAAASTLDAKLTARNPDDTGTDIDVPGASVDQIVASSTNANRKLLVGEAGGGYALATNVNFDASPAFLSKYMDYVDTIVGTITNYKVWVEYMGQV